MKDGAGASLAERGTFGDRRFSCKVCGGEAKLACDGKKKHCRMQPDKWCAYHQNFVGGDPFQPGWEKRVELSLARRE